MTPPTTVGAAIQRYKIGYHADEWGQRSSTPSGIPDASGSWVRYADHVTALAAGQATAQPVAEPADTVVLNAAMRAIQQAIELIGAPTDERMRAVRRVLRGAVVVAEDSGDIPAQPDCLTCSDHGAVGNSGFDYKTAADFLSGKTVSDEALRKFVAASRGAHDARAALHAKMLSLQGELASREAEIALLKRSLLDAEADAAAPQPSTTAQSADSVPAVSDLPPLPAPDLRDVGTKPQEIKEFLKGYATEYARTAIAARAPADSVQEDAARLDFLIEQRAYVVSDPDDRPGYWLHWARPDGSTWVQCDEQPTPRAAIDAARKQEASHDR